MILHRPALQYLPLNVGFALPVVIYSVMSLPAQGQISLAKLKFHSPGLPEQPLIYTHIARPPRQPPVILSSTPELGLGLGE